MAHPSTGNDCSGVPSIDAVHPAFQFSRMTRTDSPRVTPSMAISRLVGVHPTTVRPVNSPAEIGARSRTRSRRADMASNSPLANTRNRVSSAGRVTGSQARHDNGRPAMRSPRVPDTSVATVFALTCTVGPNPHGTRILLRPVRPTEDQSSSTGASSPMTTGRGVKPEEVRV